MDEVSEKFDISMLFPAVFVKWNLSFCLQIRLACVHYCDHAQLNMITYCKLIISRVTIFFRQDFVLHQFIMHFENNTYDKYGKISKQDRLLQLLRTKA